MRKNEYLYLIKNGFSLLLSHLRELITENHFFISESGIDRPEDYSENFVLQEQELIRCTKNDRWIYIIYIKNLK